MPAMMTPVMPLTAKQLRFCEEYLLDLNATQAAIRAGYSPRTAQEQSSRLLSNVMVAADIERRQRERSARTDVTADRVLLELSRIAFNDPRRMFRSDGTLKPPGEWDDDTAAIISGLEVEERRPLVEDAEEQPADERQEPQPHGGSLRRRRRSVSAHLHKVKRLDKLTALELLGKHLGMFREKVEVTGKDGGPIQLTAEQRAEAVAAILAQAAARLPPAPAANPTV